jgi:hypothetical protein
VLVAGGVGELGSPLQRSHLTTDSYAHPTINALGDPLHVSYPGRSAALGGESSWLVLGGPMTHHLTIVGSAAALPLA